MDESEVTWEPPGPGQWFFAPEHMPTPVTTLFAELFPHAASGWALGAERYGLPPHPATFDAVNRWYYYTPGIPDPPDVEAMEAAAAEAMATRRWRADLRRWHEDLRPSVVATNRTLLAEDLESMDDAALADHLDRAIGHFVAVGPEHFADLSGPGAAGELFEAAVGWDLDRPALLLALAGGATATSSADVLYERIATGLLAAGVHEVAGLDAVRSLGGDGEAALDELLVDYAWRAFDNDLAVPTLAERPEAIVAAVQGALTGRSSRRPPDPRSLDPLRAAVPETDRDRFDDLAAAARAAYGANDDNTTVLFSMPLGLIRRAVLEVGDRLVARDRLHQRDDALEATTVELQALLAGEGPTADDLAGRTGERLAAAALVPPPVLGSPPPPAPSVDPPPSTTRLTAMLDAYRSVAWSRATSQGQAVATVGEEVVRGRAVVATEPTDALLRMQPSDVLVAVTTTASYNTIFPMAGAVAVEHGGVMSHAAVLARELGITAVIGVPGLLDVVHDGDLVEVDPVAGTITVLDPGRGQEGSSSQRRATPA